MAETNKNINNLPEREKVTTESGKKKVKTIGETTALIETISELDKIIGRCVDVYVMDALFLNVKVMNEIKDRNQYFAIRLEMIQKIFIRMRRNI